VLREPVARVYEERQFRSAWSDPIRLNELIAAINEVDSDGLDPHDYHVDALTAFRDELRAAKTLSASDKADLDLIATDALGLAMYHLYAGKVDPVKLRHAVEFRPATAQERRRHPRAWRRARVRAASARRCRMCARRTRGTSSDASGCANIVELRPPAVGRPSRPVRR
jgi:murein L,D-transpeptidase YcbB/YkuD